MAQQSINIGTTANDGTGETVRSAFDKTNDNFTELYTDKTKFAAKQDIATTSYYKFGCVFL